MRPSFQKLKQLASPTSSSTLSFPQKTSTMEDNRNERSVLTIFDVSKAKFQTILTVLDVTKSRGPNKSTAVLFKETAVERSLSLNEFFKEVKLLRKLPSAWKDATIVATY